MESVRGPNVDPLDRLQVQEAPSAPALTGPLNPQLYCIFNLYPKKLLDNRKQTCKTIVTTNSFLDRFWVVYCVYLLSE